MTKEHMESGIKWGGPSADEYIEEDTLYDKGLKQDGSQASLEALALSVAEIFKINPQYITPGRLKKDLTVTEYYVTNSADQGVQLGVTVVMDNGSLVGTTEVVLYEFQPNSEQWFDIEKLAASFRDHLDKVLPEEG